jgi:DNA segregation ATPase FtsK/SpoIIIE-like protein
VGFNLESVAVEWETTPHIAVLGATGSGKSIFLQSLVIQAMRDEMKLLLCDMDQTSFGRFENHSALIMPIATTPQAALELVEKAVAECDRRAALFQAMPEHPQKTSEYNAIARRHGQESLPRILVILDEASATLAALGGAKGALGQVLATLGWRGRKFDIHFVFAAQEFTKEIIGPVREQVALTVCFRVRSAQMAERMGCRGAERISEKRPGLAITDRFGPLQTYFVEPAGFQPQALLPTVSDEEAQWFSRAIAETQGRLSIPILAGWGVRERAARELLAAWEQRGWVLRDPQRDNARYLTSKLIEIMSSRQTGPTASKPA